MVLVDTSVWVDHLRHGEAALAALLEAGRVLGHPFVLGELALGGLRDPGTVLGALAALPQAVVATDTEVLGFIARHGLAGSGIGYLDAHLLAEGDDVVLAGAGPLRADVDHLATTDRVIEHPATNTITRFEHND